MYLADMRRALSVLGPKFVQIYGQGEAPMTITVLPKIMHNESANPDYLSGWLRWASHARTSKYAW